MPQQARQQDFLDADDRYPWALPDGVRATRVEPDGCWLGNGSAPLEVAVARYPDGAPNRGDVRNLWTKRRGGRAQPVLLVVLYPSNGGGGDRAAVCGPVGEDPHVVSGADPCTVRRLAEAALAEPDPHSAVELLATQVAGLSAGALTGPALRNVGLFADHALATEVRLRDDWGTRAGAAAGAARQGGPALVRALGFSAERRGTVSVLYADGSAVAVAVFLDEHERADAGSARFRGRSPAEEAVTRAAQESVGWAVVVKGRRIRLHAAAASVGVGAKGL